MAEIPKLNELKGTDRVLTSIGNKLESIASSTSRWAKEMVAAGDEAGDLANKLDKQIKLDFETKEGKAKIQDLSNQLDALAKKSKTVGQAFKEKLGEGIDYAAKKLAKLQVSIAGLAIDGLISGIQRVYDLQERWTELTGKLNMQMGKLSPSMSKFTRDAGKADVAVRALGGSMGEGSRMFGEFATSYGKMETGKGTKFVLGLARGFDLGGESAGKLSRILDNVGEHVGAAAQHDQAEYFKTITLQADKAGIPLNAFAKDIAENSKLMAQFGKIGAKTFVQSAAYLKKFNIGLKEMDQFMSKFDTFDDAASSIAKLNTAFGTSINSLNMMMEQNPAKRFETIRSALLAQGKTFNTLSRNEIQLLKQQTGLDEDALSAMLDKKNAGTSYEKFLSEKDRKEKARLSAEKLMQKQLQATATTMFNFGLAADKITTAIANAIKPFLKLLGLAGQGDKDFKSFGQVMQGITDKVADFFNKLAKNKDWIAFMQKAADIVKKVASGIGDFFGKDLDKNIETIIKWFKRFEYASAALLALWGGAKILKAVGMVKDLFGAFGKLKSVPGLLDKAGSFLNGSGGTAMAGPGGIDVPGPKSSFYEGAPGAKAGMGSKVMGGVGKAVVGAGIGYGVGKGTSMGVEALGGAKESTAGNVGAAALGGIGMLIAGPLGAALGGVIGQTFGDLGSFLYDEFKTVSVSERELTSATAALEAAQKKSAAAAQKVADIDDLTHANQEVALSKWKRDNRVMSELDKRAQEKDKKGLKLGVDLNDMSADEKGAVNDRLKQLNEMGLATDQTTGAFLTMQLGGKLTAKELDSIARQSEILQDVMKRLAQETENEIKAKQAFEAANNDFEKMRQKRLITTDEQDIAKKKAAMDRAEKSTIMVDESDLKSANQKEQEEYKVYKEAFGKEAALQNLGAKRTKEMQAQAKADYEMAQAKKMKDMTKAEDLETAHQDNLYKIALQNQIMQGDEYKQFRAGAGKSLDPSKAFEGFLGSKKLTGASADLEKILPGVPKFAEGGIVRKKQLAIVGESGPEMIVPMSRGMDLGGGASGGPVNYAGARGKAGSGGSETKIVAGDVYLDSKLVGRHLVRSILNDARG